MQRQVLAEESVRVAQEDQSLFMQVVADARVINCGISSSSRSYTSARLQKQTWV